MRSWLSQLPHQIPFRAVSHIEAGEGSSMKGTMLVSAGDSLQGMPSDLMLIEAMAQVGGARVFAGGEKGFLSGVDRVEIHDRIEPGDRLDLHVTLDAELGGLYRFQGTAFREGRLLATARFYLASTARVGT